MSRSGYGLVRAEQSGLLAETGKMLSGAPVHIVVVMLGMNDRISVRTETGHVQPGSAEWKELYGKEAEKLIKKLRNASVAVYWVGLPPISNSSLNELVPPALTIPSGKRFISTAPNSSKPPPASPTGRAPTALGEPTFPGRRSACAKATARG